MAIDFFKEFEKASMKNDRVLMENKAPEFFVDSGNYVINKIISGNYKKGWAQGRLGMLAGPSGVGKSFLLGNAIYAAQQQGMGILIIDSENALDEEYLGKIGVDVNVNNFLYRGVKTIPDASEQWSTFTKLYRKHGMTDRYMICMDSLDMLLTESELNKFDKGESGGDQGQQAKQLKKMLATFQQDIKNLPMVGLMTKQAYKEQDPIAAKSMPFVVTEAVKFAFTQSLMLQKLMLKDDATKLYEGITLKILGYKTRFTKPFQQAKIEVPYDAGMDRFTGLLEVAEALGVITAKGSYKCFNGNNFYKKDFETVAEAVLDTLMAMDEGTPINVQIDDGTDDVVETRQALLARKLKELDKKEAEVSDD